MLEIEIYSHNGKSPYVEWLKDLDAVARAKIRARINRIAETGNFGDYKPVGGSVYEIRVDFGPGYRIYFGYKNKKIIILLRGGDKSSQVKDIRKAKELLKDYLEE